MNPKIRAILTHPIDVLFRQFLAYTCKTGDGYDAAKYWHARHARYGFDLRGVGNASLSSDENSQQYLHAKNTFLALCQQEKIDFQRTSLLDVGCGTGFYADIFREQGGTRYLGVDITDVLFPELQAKFPSSFRFRKQDITDEPLDDMFDLAIMIDVTQHIVNDAKFSFAMQNIRNHLCSGGSFIVTSWLTRDERRGIYERSRTLDYYRREFPHDAFSEPLPFREKFIFTIRKQ